MNETFMLASIAFFVFGSVYLLVRYGYGPAYALWLNQEHYYDRVLRQQLLIDIQPRMVVVANLIGVFIVGAFAYVAAESAIVGFFFAGLTLFVPLLLVRHLVAKRRQKLETQLVDGLTTLASGVRAGLTLTQSMEMLVKNATGPIQEEFSQLLREYQMGVDLNQAMRNASNRIESPLYRLTFTAIEMHRLRGGNAGESLDRIAESVREIQRLEGKLDALTAQGRAQASMMAGMVFVFIIIYYMIAPETVSLLFTDAWGRLILLVVAVLVVIGFLWIRRIMEVDI